ncbi:MAG: c-type cytochrome, partial [Planctomycetaceae bacterium]|nr:c-type cytochrome [Planctomycetaceae bacterium]
ETLGPETIPDWGKVITRNERYGSTVAAMLKDMPPARKIHLLLVLRNVKEGWTLPQRKQYFNMFVDVSQHPGGNSYAGFLRQIRDDAWATCAPGEKVVLGDLVGRPLGSKPFVAKPARGPMRTWTKEAALAALEKPLRKRSLAAGRNLFHATQCAKCHRFAGEGGAVGPDLSTALQKYSIPDLLDSMLTPSKVISDQYGSHQVTTDAGKVLVGRAVEVGKELFVYTVESGARPIIIKKDEVDEMVVSKVSQMPAGLMNALNEEELRDLIAYLQSGGNPKWKGYR